MKKSLFLILIMVFAIFTFALEISEFIVTPTGSEAIEIYNETAGDIDMTNYYFVVSGGTWADTTQFKTTTVSAGAYVSFTMDTINFTVDVGLPNDGATLYLYDASWTLLSSVGYGNKGEAPAPIYNFSTAKINSTGDNAVDYNMDSSPTMGAANDASTNALGTGTVFLNEVFADTSSSNTQFIELYNSGTTGVDISNWIIVCNDDYVIPSTVLGADAYFVLLQGDFPQYFYLDPTYENVYLYDNNYQRIDQVGFDNIPNDSSFSVLLNGVRTDYTGYNTSTSVDFGNALPTQGSTNSPGANIDDNNTLVSPVNISLCNAGISIENNNNISGKLSIIDISGRTLYSSNIKNVIIAVKPGIYFVNLQIGKKTIIKKMNLIK